MQVEASGDANLGILQGFFRDIRSRGTAALKAQISGTLDKPVFSGSASIVEGRLRYMPVPHALEAINGRITFDAGGVRVDDVSARLGEGEVHFGGRIGLNGFAPGDITLTASGEQMRVRYPEGFVSVIDADLTLQGTLAGARAQRHGQGPQRAVDGRIETTPDLFNLGGNAPRSATTAPADQTFPLRLDLDIDAPQRAANPEQHRQHGRQRRPASCRAPTIGRGSSATPRSSAAIRCSRAIATRHAAAASTSSTRRGSSRSSTSKPKRGCGCRDTTYLRDGRLQRDHQPVLAAAQLGSAAARVRHHLAPARPDDRLENPELRALRPDAARQTQEALLREAVVRLATNPVSAPVSRLIGEKIGIDTVDRADARAPKATRCRRRPG